MHCKCTHAKTVVLVLWTHPLLHLMEYIIYEGFGEFCVTPSALLNSVGVVHLSIFRTTMMTSSNGNIFRVTGHLCGEFTGPGEFPTHKGQRRGALMFSLICAWINGWVNNRGAGDLRHSRAHYDVNVLLHWRLGIFCDYGQRRVFNLLWYFIFCYTVWLYTGGCPSALWRIFFKSRLSHFIFFCR